MVHVTLADSSSSVVIPSGTITGPLSFWADEVTQGTTDYDSGILLVIAGTAHQTSTISPAHAIAWPYALLVAMAAGIIAARR